MRRALRATAVTYHSWSAITVPALQRERVLAGAVGTGRRDLVEARLAGRLAPQSDLGARRGIRVRPPEITTFCPARRRIGRGRDRQARQRTRVGAQQVPAVSRLRAARGGAARWRACRSTGRSGSRSAAHAAGSSGRTGQHGTIIGRCCGQTICGVAPAGPATRQDRRARRRAARQRRAGAMRRSIAKSGRAEATNASEG